MAEQQAPDPAAKPAPPNRARRRWPVVFFFLLGALLFAAAALLLGAIFLEVVGEDLPESARHWIAVLVALGVAGVLPSFLALRLAKSALSATRIFAGWNLLLVIAFLGLTPSLSRRALESHGAWPSALTGEPSPTWADATRVVAGLLPGAGERAPTSGTADAGEDAGAASQPAAAHGAQAVFERAADAVVFIGVRASVDPKSLEAKILGALGMKEIEGHGSGFAVAPDGLIVTNHHVVARARSAMVRLRDGRVFTEVQILADDPGDDLALIKVAASDLKTLTLLEQDDVPVGTNAFAIGSPLGLDFTLTSGIVSARREQQKTSMLQMQTTIAPGSSGGPVLDDAARVIGVSTATRGAGLNMAVHVRHVHDLLARERNPRPLQPWEPDVELTALEVAGAEALPTVRAQLEMLSKFAAKAVEGCLERMPAEGAQVDIQLADEIFASPRLQTNLGAAVERCLVPALEMISFQTALVMREQDGTPQVSCSFKGLRTASDGRPPEQRTLRLIISMPTSGTGDAGSRKDGSTAGVDGSAGS